MPHHRGENAALIKGGQRIDYFRIEPQDMIAYHMLADERQ